ncbi:MAG: TetR family transcriptional regulator [Microbacterium sp.]
MPLTSPSTTASPAGGGRGRPRLTTRGKIQRAAVELFVRRGYEATSVEDIARELDIGRTTFFRYFPTKSAVIWHDYEEATKALADLLARIPSDAPLLASVGDAIVASAESAAQDRVFARARSALIMDVPELFRTGAAAGARWAEAVASHVRARAGAHVHPALPDAIAFALLGVLEACVRTWVEEDDASLAELLRSGVELVASAMQGALERDAG